MSNRYLTFSIENENYGLDIQTVRELVSLIDYTHVPKMPNHTKGIMNLRGKVVTVVDLRLRFGMNEIEYDDRTSVVVIDLEKNNINPTGLIVDRINEVIEFEDEEIDRIVSLDSTIDSDYIIGIGKKNGELTILLDIYKIISSKKRKNVEIQHNDKEEN